jgi:UTP--glucose-1-phosphate uridylyltransferase
MLDVYNEYQKSVVALMNVDQADVSKFGICGGNKIAERIIDINTMVEKPKLEEAPSSLAIVGRYILNPDIFRILEATDPGKGGEIQLTDAMATLMRKEGFLGYEFEGERYDAGDKFGYLKANIAYGMKRPDIREQLIEYMRTII